MTHDALFYLYQLPYSSTPFGNRSWVACQVALMVKNSPANAGDVRDAGLIPGLGRSPAEGHGKPLQYSFLENPHGQGSLAGYSPWVTKSWT